MYEEKLGDRRHLIDAANRECRPQVNRPANFGGAPGFMSQGLGIQAGGNPGPENHGARRSGNDRLNPPPRASTSRPLSMPSYGDIVAASGKPAQVAHHAGSRFQAPKPTSAPVFRLNFPQYQFDEPRPQTPAGAGAFGVSTMMKDPFVMVPAPEKDALVIY